MREVGWNLVTIVAIVLSVLWCVGIDAPWITP